MIRGAGILFLTADNQALFLKRAPGSDYPLFWCLPGGTLEEGETTEQCAKREAEEEIGFLPSYLPNAPLTKHSVTVSPRDTQIVKETIEPRDAEPPLPDLVEFTTYLQRVDGTFEPRINGEHIGWSWAPISGPPEPLHPGVRVALQKLGMHELDVAKAIRDGQLASPQQFENMWLFAMRITGTGVAFRKKLNEYVYRRPENYLTDEFLARCNGLAVIVQHPKGDKLDSQEFAERVVGSVMLPYIKGDEVWGISKIYDETTAEMLSKFQLSTSPAVVLRSGANTKLKAEDGKTVLIEGEPKLLDHLAICEVGVWDKGEDPSGVAVEAIGDDQMAEDKKVEEKEEKKDSTKSDGEIDLAKEGGGGGGSGQHLDKMLSHLDDCIKRMDARLDAMGSRMDAMADSMKRDDKHRDDEDKDKEEKKEDSKKDAKRDDAHRDDKKDDDSKKRDDDDARKDKKRDDASAEQPTKEPGEAKEVVADKKRKDDDDSKRKDDASKKRDDSMADSNSDIRKSLADLQKKIPEIERALPAAMSDADFRGLADAQERADTVFTAWGERAPIPLRGESVLAYRRRVATKQKVHSSNWKGIDLDVITDDNAFAIAEKQIYADSIAASAQPGNVPDGQLRAITRKTPTGHTEITFVGSPHAWMSQFSRGRSRFVTKINPKPDAAA